MGKHITKRHPRSCWSTEKAVTCSCEGEKHYFEHLLNENRLFSEPPTATEENMFHVISVAPAKFYPTRTTLGRKNDVMSIFRMGDLSHLLF